MSLTEVATYTLTAWVDADGSGAIDNGETELSVTVETAQITALTTYSVNSPENLVISDADSTDDVLYVELEDGETSVPIEFFPTYSTSNALPADYLFYRVEGAGANANEALVSENGDVVSLNLTEAGETYTVAVGFDLDGNGILDESEVTVSSDVVVVRIDELYVAETGFDSNVVATTESEPFKTIYVAAQASGAATVSIDAIGLPLSAEAGENVLWRASSLGFSFEENDGNFGVEDPVITATPLPNTTENEFFVGVGFDDDSDGVLDPGLEQTRLVKVVIFSFELIVGQPETLDVISYKPSSGLTETNEYEGHEFVDLQVNVVENNVSFEEVKHRIVAPTVKTFTTTSGTEVTNLSTQGTIEEVDVEEGKWRYIAPIEEISNKHPVDLLPFLHVTAEGSDRSSEDNVLIKSLFKYFKNEVGDQIKTMNYVNDKYSLVDVATFKSNEFKYNPDLTSDGFTGNIFGNRFVQIGPTAFLNENKLATTIGHENVHYTQPAIQFFSLLEAVKERPAFEWELENKEHTGINQIEIDWAQSWIDYFDDPENNPKPE